MSSSKTPKTSKASKPAAASPADELKALRLENEQLKRVINQKDDTIANRDAAIASHDDAIAKRDAIIASLTEEVGVLADRNKDLNQVVDEVTDELFEERNVHVEVAKERDELKEENDKFREPDFMLEVMLSVGFMEEREPEPSGWNYRLREGAIATPKIEPPYADQDRDEPKPQEQRVVDIQTLIDMFERLKID